MLAIVMMLFFILFHYIFYILAYQTGFSAVFTRARIFYIPWCKDDSSALNEVIVDVRESLWMNDAVIWHHLNIYEWMCKFIRHFKNIVHSTMQTLIPILLIFIKKWYTRKSNYQWQLVRLGISSFWVTCFNLQYHEKPRYCINNPPSRPENPICTVY